MNNSFDSRALRLSATLLLAGQLLYVLVTLLDTGGEANQHEAIFAAYAASQIWTAVHAAQFVCMTIMLAGLFALCFALGDQSESARWATRFGAGLTVAALALYGAVLAVDGVALKQAANAWASAPEAEKTARFATAESVRWLEWGTRSYTNFTLGLAVLALAVAVARTARIPRPIAYVMALSSAAYFVQGWLGGSVGFSTAHTDALVLTEVLNAVWMTWLVVVAWRMQESGSGVLAA